jgi:hypothetical protein
VVDLDRPERPGAYVHTDMEIEEIAERAARGINKPPWPAIIALGLALGNAIFSFGVIYTTQQVHDRQLTDLQHKEDGDLDRLARIEATALADRALLQQHIADDYKRMGPPPK